MEVINHTQKRTDRSLLVITHLSQLLYYITGFGGLVVPLILWLTQKDKVEDMDEHGKSIVNFQISLILFTIVSIPAILLVGLGILMLIFLGIIGFVVPIINAVRANNGESPTYFMTIRFIK
ncbi:MAG: tRNA modification GTPase [Alteromonas sp.]|nr:tRNA modification GTPase [Alteromonas sp.]MAY22725.1 tRNA modification GTPase [Flavobacteriaceae bacterium]